MNNLKEYIFEKFQISKDIKNDINDLKSFDKWKEYLENNGINCFRYNPDVYSLYLKKSNYKIQDTREKWKNKFTIPFVDIATYDSGFDFYMYEQGKIEIFIDSKDSQNVILVLPNKDMDLTGNRLDGKYKFSVNNANFIIDNLNKVYSKSK